MLHGQPAHRGRVDDVRRESDVAVTDRDVVRDPHDEWSDVEIVAGFLEPQPARSLDRRVAGGEGRAHTRQRAEVPDEGRGRLVADPLDSRQPVAGVPAHGGHVGIGIAGGHPVLALEEGLGDDVGVAHPAAGRVEHAGGRGVVDELEEVAVAGDDVDRHHVAVAHGIGADDVIGLVVGGPDAGDADRRERVDDDRDLRGQLVGDLLAVGGVLGDPVRLVGGDGVDAPLRPPVVVPAGHDVRGPVSRDERGEHVEEAGDGIGRQTGGHRRPLRHPVEGTEVQRGGVEQEQAVTCRVGHGPDLTGPSPMVHPWKRQIDASSTSCAPTGG